MTAVDRDRAGWRAWLRRTGGGARSLAGRVDGSQPLVALLRRVRRRLPGDARYGDPLSVAGPDPVDRIGARLAAVAAEQPSALRELGLTALQVWQAGGQPSRLPPAEVAVVFTDLAGFSDWTLRAGDETAVELLRRVGAVAEPLITAHGRIVKRLGDGLMAVFHDPEAAVAAVLAARDAVDAVVVDGHRLRLRAGVHVGAPRRLGADYFGQDVNIAARVTAAAGPGEVLISTAAAGRLDGARFRLRRRLWFRAKGVPADVRLYAVSSADGDRERG
ncbi:adenylate/guanylate cyclase domain-containing protein [Amycolatopsis aidingensis]|uniref:adenylate/guanylate cyclase domain-containing protein n=1 Tax=Amycolatopsis aidingensis TaxID=2842453 RepID=UPI001C0D8EEA|nr:adenylate/guanylate cyclase domain-containing protein [Amycolatopsis aidingensis]